MTSKRLLVLAPAILALLVAGGWGIRCLSSFEVQKQAPAVVASVLSAPAAAPVLPSTLSEADEALNISMLLSGPQKPAALFDSRQREARERAGRLGARLREHPDAWGDVLDLLCILEPEDKAIALADFLVDAVEAPSEPRLLSLLKSGPRQGRCVALKLLSSRRNSDTLAALMAAAEDFEPKIRLNALLALAERRQDSQDAVDAELARRARLEPDPVLQDTARRLLGENVPSRYPAPVPQRAPLSRSTLGAPRPAPAK